ncbi:hypothetical protein ABT131_05245 [Streptomyces sp900105245]|uniref:hypothetical protein n=1 Tax=Streptomyces sp. 900105245 TaxID=3154379 RepID=UPI00331AC929
MARRTGRAGGGGGASGDGQAAKYVGQFDGGSAARGTPLATLPRALDGLEWRLALREDVLGGELTWLWATLVPLDTVHRCHLAAAAVHHVTEHPHL